MLSPHDLELLTAHIDGELTRRQRRQVCRLLDHSGEARELLRKLDDDARLLRRLPAITAPADVSAAVLDRITRRRVRRPASPRPAVEASRFSPWLGLATAASVLLLVGATGFFFDPEEAPPQKDRLVVLDKAVKLPPRRDARDREPPEADGSKENVTPPVAPAAPEEGKEKAAPVPTRKDPPAEGPPARDSRTVLTSPGNESTSEFEQVEPSLPTLWKLHELDRGDAAAQLTGALRGGEGSRVELLARDATRGFERLRAALNDAKVQLTFDPAVLPRLKKPLWKTDYAVFVENVTPEDLVAALRATGVADRQAVEKKSGESRFDGPVVVKDLARADRKELAELLGVDPVATRPGRGGIPGGVMGYVTLLSGVRSRPLELERYLEERRPATPGTIQVFLIVRHLGG